MPASLHDFMAAAASAISAGESSKADSPALLFKSSTWPGFARSFWPSPKIHARASARFEKSFFTTGPPVNRLPRRTRQNSRPRPLVVFATPTPEGKSLIRALKRAKFIRQLSAHVNNRVKCQTVNPLAYAFRGSNPLLPIALKPACIKDLRFFAFWKRFSIVQYRTDRIRPKSVHKLSTDLCRFRRVKRLISARCKTEELGLHSGTRSRERTLRGYRRDTAINPHKR
jgi:hypothetical protein